MTKQFIHSFKGFGRVLSSINVRIFSDDGENFILFEDINDGTSVTNASEQLASEIVGKEGFNPPDCRFFETYSQYGYESIDEIEYVWNGKSASHPNWKPSEPEIREMFNL